MEIKTTTIKELIALGVSEEKILALCGKLYDMTDFISEDYPKHKTWFYTKHLPETMDESSGRDIIYAHNGYDIFGTSFIKKDEQEKKICTLFVDESARGLGVGTKLVEKSMDVLGTTKPMITLADYKLPMFSGLIKKYEWEQTQVVKGLYNDRSLELVYNGILEDNKSNEKQMGE